MDNNYEIIQNNLRKSDAAASRDKANFEKYVLGQVSLSECNHYFKLNNCIRASESDKITDEMFKDWMRSLGWF